MHLNHFTPKPGNTARRGLAATALLALTMIGCRGGTQDKPPMHVVLDMDFQSKVKPQMRIENFSSFADQRAMRLPVEGTVARGSLKDAPLDVWKDGDNYLANPVPASMEVLERGQERFNIHCAVCHDRSGGGKGLVLERAQPGAFAAKLPDLGQEPRLRDQADGYFYEVIRNGFSTMPAYGHQVPVSDRWAIVHYLRALQNRFE